MYKNVSDNKLNCNKTEMKLKSGWFLLFIVSCFGFVNCQECTTNAAIREEDKPMHYLHQYGYMDDMDNMNKEKMQDAVKNFQNFMGMEMTGVLDDETMKMIHTPRCAMPDKGPRRVKRQAYGIRRNQNIRYAVESVPKYISHFAESEIAAAMRHWSNLIPRSFTKVTSRETSDVYIHFKPCDGSGRILGYAYYPPGRELRLDVAERWTANMASGTNLQQLVVHEMGHSLGLEHSNVQGAVMYPYYRYQSNFRLHSDDIQRIQRLYGARTRRGYTEELSCPQNGIDAIFNATDNYIYMFKDDDYWRLDHSFTVVDGPSSIRSKWPALPMKIDAAFTFKDRMYFFRNHTFWKYTESRKDGNSKLISVGFPGLSSNLDAATVWRGYVYFFKGSNYWIYNMGTSSIPDGFPKKISEAFPGAPESVDAALGLGESMYLFKNGKYILYSPTDYRSGVTPKNVNELVVCNVIPSE